MNKPNLTDDYLMRMIAQAVAVLANILNLRKAGSYQEALQQVDEALSSLLGLPSSVIKNMDDPTILQVLTPQSHLDDRRAELVGDILREQAEIYTANGKFPEAFLSRQRALIYYLEAGLVQEPEPAQELKDKVQSLFEQIGISNINEDALWALFCYQENIKAYPQAEAALLELAHRPGIGDSLQPEIDAFYERMRML